MTYNIYFSNDKTSGWITRKELKKALKSLLDKPWLIVREISDFVVVNSNFDSILEAYPKKGYLVDHSNFYKQGKDAILDI